MCNLNPTYNIYIYEMGSSYTFFKLLDLSRSNGQKNILINANILIDLVGKIGLEMYIGPRALSEDT